MHRRIFHIVMAVLFVLIVARAGSNALTLFFENDPRIAGKEAGSDVASIAERRFGLFKPLLAEDAVVGYVTVREIDVSAAGGIWYGAAQYCLAPRVVRHSDQEEILIASFPDDALLEQYLTTHAVQMQRHVGPGLAVVKNLNYKKPQRGAEAP